jgi:integrase/recombinase XerD
MLVMHVIFMDILTSRGGWLCGDGGPEMSAFDPCLTRSRGPSGEPVVRLGVPLLDDYLEFLAGRSRPNTVLAAAYDLKVFFGVVAKAPGEVCPADVLGFITAQRTGRVGHAVVQSLAGGGEPGGVSTSTVARRLSVISGFFAFLQVRGDVAMNPVPRGLPTRRERSRPGQGVPLTRRTRRLPRILTPGEVDALTAALRTHRDRAMVAAMVLGGLRRCEVLGLRMEDLRPGERRVFIADGKGGHQRLVPVSARFFVAVQAYLHAERPPGLGTDAVFVALKGPRRGQPLAVRGLDEILSGARRRAGLGHATCHELRHTCLTRLREAGMALEAVQAQAGHASIESTRIYLHLADDWLASQYRKAAEVIDAQVFAAHPAAAGTGGGR